MRQDDVVVHHLCDRARGRGGCGPVGGDGAAVVAERGGRGHCAAVGSIKSPPTQKIKNKK